MGDCPTHWLVWIADGMDRLHDRPEALDRLREYARAVAGSGRPHALAVRDSAGIDAATAAERAMVLVRLHDHYADDGAPEALRQAAASRQWSLLCPKLELSFEAEVGLAASTVWALRATPELAGQWLHGLFDGLGIALAREAPREEPPEVAGPSDSAVRPYGVSDLAQHIARQPVGEQDAHRIVAVVTARKVSDELMRTGRSSVVCRYYRTRLWEALGYDNERSFKALEQRASRVMKGESRQTLEDFRKVSLGVAKDTTRSLAEKTVRKIMLG